MFFNDFLAIDCIDLTGSSVQPASKKLKTTIPSQVLQQQHVKEQELLGFLYDDQERKVDQILKNAGVFEEQWIQFISYPRFANK